MLPNHPRKFCVLCAEVADTAYLNKKIGAAETQHAVERCLHRMQRVSARFNARFAKLVATTEFTAAFDAVEDAYLAANEMQERIADLPPVSGLQLAIRLGYHYAPAGGDGQEVSADAQAHAWRLAMLAKPGQVLISAEAQAALPEELRGSVRELVPGDDLGLGEGKIYEVMWPDSPASWQHPADRVLASFAGARLALRHGQERLALGPEKGELALGRHPNNDIVIRDPRASRRHARIERRDDQFILADRSSNGTYIAFDGGEEVTLKRNELVLHGRGHICFGRSYGPETAEVVEFELLLD